MQSDLIVKVGVNRHPSIKREGIDALSEKEIWAIDAVMGCEVEVETIYG